MDPKDRRVFPRFNLQVDVALRVLEETGSRKASTVNISRGGVCLIAYQAVVEGDLLELDISLPETKEPVSINGKVAWVREFCIGAAEQGKRFDVGVEFIDVSDTTLTVLNQYLFTRTLQ